MILPKSKSRQLGLTLIELMIALVLGLLLVAAATQVFLSNKQTYRVTEAHSRLQDNARFATEIISRDIRAAGYSGCRAIENINVNTIANAPIPATISENTVITGINAETAATWNSAVSGLLGTVVGGTDILTLQRASSCGASLVGNVGSSNGNVQVFTPNTCNLQANDVLMISDCEDAHIFRATNVSSGVSIQTVAHANSHNQANHFCKNYASLPHAGACSTGDAKLYGYDSELLKFSSTTYFIRLGSGGTPALWSYEDGSATAQELVEGVENLQVLYGVDDNNDDIVDRYADAKVINDAGAWNLVVNAQISLLMATIEQNLTTEPQSVTFDGVVNSGADGRIRRIITTTIGIRNRVQ
jgi:type IV pilus assembly protein PilW